MRGEELIIGSVADQELVAHVLKQFDIECVMHFAAYAESCGGLGLRVERTEDLREALRRAITHDGPALVEVVADVELI